MKKTILITGIKGFLASNLITLLAKDYMLYGIGKKEEFQSNLQIFSSEEIEKIEIVPDFIIVCHAAISSGQTVLDNETLFDVNVRITEQLVTKFSNSKIIYISTVSIYDVTSNLIYENSNCNPQSEYAISKLWAEKVIFKSSNAVCLRLSSLFGIGMKENTILPIYVNQAIINGKIEVWGDGKRKQNYIYVLDACEYIRRIIDKFDIVKGKVLLGVNKKEFSNLALAEIITEFTKAEILFKKDDKAISFQYNNDLTCQLLDFIPSSEFKVELQNYIIWKQKQY